MIGTRLGSYEITARLGAGGMGEVYRATDTRLNREVAIKVLPESVAQDPERLARFEREAKVLASLNHSGIATLHGLEEGASAPALVMELVEGPTLADRIAQGPMSIEEALPIARQVAEGLEYAHERGVVHRDLKPANIKLTSDGQVKILDFGLAKALDSESMGRPVDPSYSPTLTCQATAQGVILGTAAYMAPEQAAGKAVDKRADIWAFGVVLYEILTGGRLFTGDSVPETLAEVLKGEIDLGLLPETTPPAIQRLLRRCLERNPKNRLHDIADARLEIDASGESTGAEALATRESGVGRRALHVGVLLGVFAGIVLGGLVVWQFESNPPRPAWKLALAPPPEVSGFRMSPRISPDGRSVAYLADGKLWVQELDGLTPREIPKSDGATALTWSPDGRALAFAARTQLLRTLPNGDVSQVTRLQEAISSGSGGITWTADDSIVFSTGNSGLYTVAVAGGTPSLLLEPDKSRESDFHEPFALPDGRGILFFVHRTPGGIIAVDLFADGRRRTLFEQEHSWLSGLAWSADGHLLVGSLGRNPGVWAVPLSPGNLEPTGAPFMVMANTSSPSISRGGMLLLSNVSSIGHHQLVRVDRKGGRLSSIGEPLQHGDHATFSPDGTRVAVCGFESKGESVWVYDLQRGSRSRLWSDVSCGGISEGLTWSPDGEFLAVADSATGMIHVRRSDGSDEGKELVEGMQPTLSPDGTALLFTRLSPETKKDLWVLPLARGATARSFLATKASEEQAHVSPDGHYVAYVSDETGRNEVFLRPFPQGPGRWQVSVSGGDMPRWSQDGKRLYFLQDDDAIMEVETDLHGTPVLSDPRALFSATGHRLGPEHGYDPSPDGEGFVTVEIGAATTSGGDLTLISPWPDQSTDK